MSAFQNLPGAQIENPGPLTADQLAFADEKLQDQAALNLVLQDIYYAKRHQDEKRFQIDIETADNIYRAYVKPRNWPGTDVARANLGMPLVLETIDISLLPATYMSFFSDPQPFLLEPKGKTKPDAARAISKVLGWEVDESQFPEEIRKIMKSCLQYGTGVGQWGWATDTIKTKTYIQKGAPITAGSGAGMVTVPTTESDTVEAKVVEKQISKPTIEYVDLRNLFVDPNCREQDIRSSRYIVKQIFLDSDQIDALRDNPAYKNIPSREALKSAMAARSETPTNSAQSSQHYYQPDLQASRKDEVVSANTLLQPLEVLEYWTPDRVITVLQRTIVIRNEKNEFNRLPFVSCSFIDVLNSFYGYGIAQLLGPEQLLQQGVVNTYIDSLALSLQPHFQRPKGLGSSSQTIQISPGKIESVDGELKPLTAPSVSAEAMSAIQNSEQRAVRRVGAQGADNMPTQALRTAEGVQSFTSGVAARMQYFVDCFARLVYIPILEAFIELAKDNLKPSQIQSILSDADGQLYEGAIMDLYNGNYSIKVLSSTKLAARRAMSNLIPMFIQLFSAEPVQDSLQVQSKKVDYVELVEQSFDLIGWDGSNIIVDMTDEDKQRANPEQQKAQAAAAAQQQKQQDTLAQIEATGEMRSGVNVVKHILDGANQNDPVSLGL